MANEVETNSPAPNSSRTTNTIPADVLVGVALAVGGILLVAAFPSAYAAARLAVTVAAGLAIRHSVKVARLTGWVWVFAPIAVLFNPIYPVYLQKRSLWLAIDAVVLLIFIVFAAATRWAKVEREN